MRPGLHPLPAGYDAYDLRPQDGTWTGTQSVDGATSTGTLDVNSMVLTDACGMLPSVRFALTKNGCNSTRKRSTGE